MSALTHRQRGFIAGLCLFGGIFVAYVASLAEAEVGTDGFANSFAAWHLAHSGSPFLDDAQLPVINGGPQYFGPNSDGHIVVNRTPGQIWAAAPFYMMLSGGDFADFNTGAGSLASAFWSALAMLFFFLALRSHLSVMPAAVATAVLAFATPVWSVAAETLWPHTITIFGIAAGSWAAARERWGVAGLLLGVGILARPHVAVVAAILGLGMTYSRRSVRPALLMGLGSGVMTLVLVAWNRFVFESWSLAGAYSQQLGNVVAGRRESRLGDGYLAQVLGALISPNRGFFVWTPLVLLLLPAVWRYRNRLPAWTLWLALGGIAYAIVQSALNEWTGGSGFNGYRLTLELLVCLAPSCAMAAAYVGPVTRRLAPYIVAYQLAVTAVAALIDDSLGESDFWTDNTVLFGLREQTLVTLLLIVGFGLVGWFGTKWFIDRSQVGSTSGSATEDPTAVNVS